MRRLYHLGAVALAGVFALAVPAYSETASSIETVEAKSTAATAAAIARYDMEEAFGVTALKTGQFLWRKGGNGPARLVISLSDQLVYLYRDNMLIAVSSISSGKPGTATPTGIFSVLDKRKIHRSIKYDNAPMPNMQRIDKYGIALHGGQLPGYPASHGCIRLPGQFASKLFTVTQLGTPVLIGA